MNSSLFINWCIWTILSLVILVGTTVHILSSGKIIPIKLQVNQKATTSLIRIFPATFSFKIWIPKGHNLPRHAQCNSNKNYTEILCKKLSPRILINVVLNDKSEVYEVMPVSGWGSKATSHYTVPFIEDDNPYLFHLSKEDRSRSITRIKSKVEFTIIDVEKKLKGEIIEIAILGAIPFKFEPKGGYRLFWWFHFWPFYVLSLIIYALILLFITKKSQKQRAIDFP